MKPVPNLIITVSWNRILSALLAIIYIICAYAAGGGEASCKVIIFLIFPLGCIWFSQAMGDYTGPTTSMPITQASPGLMVCILGWVLLLLPIVTGIIVYVAG